jgi:hypothetical protein
MSRTSRDSTFERWEQLLKAVRENRAELRGVAPFLEAFERAYLVAKSNRALRKVARDSAQAATRRLKTSITRSSDAASCLRSYIKGLLGPRSEKLHRYGMKPITERRTVRQKQQVGFERPN